MATTMTISATTQGIKPGVCTSTNRPSTPFDGQVIYMTDVDQTAVWDGTQWTVLAPIAGGRNIMINGAMNVWQRGTNTGTLALGGGSYVGPDRWWYYNNAFTTTMSQQPCGSTLPQFKNCLRIQRTAGQTGTTAAVILSPQETVNSVRLAGKNATLSFYARASSGISTPTALIGYVHTGTGIDEKNFGAGYTGGAIVATSNPTLTTSWQRFSVTGAIPSTTTEVCVQFQFWGSGTAGASDYLEITGVQLEEGAVATPFEFEDAQVTLAKCQRYYEKTYNIDTAIGTATQNGMVGIDISADTNTNNYLIRRTQFQVRKRTAPSITVYDASGNAGKCMRFDTSAAGTDNTTVSGVDSIGETSFRTYIVSQNCAGYTFHYVASAEL